MCIYFFRWQTEEKCIKAGIDFSSWLILFYLLKQGLIQHFCMLNATFFELESSHIEYSELLQGIYSLLQKIFNVDELEYSFSAQV